MQQWVKFVPLCHFASRKHSCLFHTSEVDIIQMAKWIRNDRTCSLHVFMILLCITKIRLAVSWEKVPFTMHNQGRLEFGWILIQEGMFVVIWHGHATYTPRWNANNWFIPWKRTVIGFLPRMGSTYFDLTLPFSTATSCELFSPQVLPKPKTSGTGSRLCVGT